MPFYSIEGANACRDARRGLAWHTCVARRVIGCQLTHKTIILGIKYVTITWRAMLSRPGPTSRPTNARCMASSTTRSVAAAGASSQGRKLKIEPTLECSSSYVSCKPRIHALNVRILLGDPREPKDEMLPCRKDVTPEEKTQGAPSHLRTERRHER